ncbi:hypothetical protein ACSNN9_26925 [Micromonospora sp. URMC 107]
MTDPAAGATADHDRADHDRADHDRPATSAASTAEDLTAGPEGRP